MTPSSATWSALARARSGSPTSTSRSLVAQHDPLMSPLVWDLAHVGQQEDLWLLRGGDAARPGLLPPDVDALYDAFEHPRADRPSLPLLPPVEARAFIADVRGRVLDLLERTPADDLFPSGMVEQHEQQHDETMLATHQLRQGQPVLLGRRRAAARARRQHDARARARRAVRARGRRGRRAVVARQRAAGAHASTWPVPDRPVSRSPTAVAGVHRRRRLRPAASCGRHRGWAHRIEAGLERPLFWTADGTRRRFGVEEIPPDEPVQHVCYFEAEAYAALGRRAAAHRERVGEGLRVGPGAGPTAALAVGQRSRPARPASTSAATRCARRRSAPTRPAPRRTASSS